jgi:hypothetical protein
MRSRVDTLLYISLGMLGFALSASALDPYPWLKFWLGVGNAGILAWKAKRSSGATSIKT